MITRGCVRLPQDVFIEHGPEQHELLAANLNDSGGSAYEGKEKLDSTYEEMEGETYVVCGRGSHKELKSLHNLARGKTRRSYNQAVRLFVAVYCRQVVLLALSPVQL
ncbi:hypothetical protein ACJJTC_005053 [Scirpophaga incertulas]